MSQPQQAQIVNTAQIAALLGLSREYVTDNVTKRPDFPRPVLNLSRRVRGWSKQAVVDWAKKRTQAANGGR